MLVAKSYPALHGAWILRGTQTWFIPPPGLSVTESRSSHLPDTYLIFPVSALPLAPDVFPASGLSPLAIAHRALRAAFLKTDWVFFLIRLSVVPSPKRPSTLPLTRHLSQGHLSTLLLPRPSDPGPFASARWCHWLPSFVVGTHS